MRAKKILYINFFICFALFADFILINFTSCEEKFVPFQDLPNTNLEDEYFTNLSENYTRYSNMYTYLVVDYMEKNQTLEFGTNYHYDVTEPEIAEYKKQYDEWKAIYPSYIEKIDENLPDLIEITKHITYSNRVKHLESMKKTIDDYIKCVYLKDPEATDNYYSLISENFAKISNIDSIQDYLAEHYINIASISFPEIFDSLVHRLYPFGIDYKFMVSYYIGEKEQEEPKMLSATVKLRYFIGLNEDRKYIIEYISDPSKITEIPPPTANTSR